MTDSNNRISTLVSSQVPFFVRNDHQAFIRFLELYYEFLEQQGGEINTIKNIQNYFDVDTSAGQFLEKLYQIYLKYIPDNTAADKSLILKNIKEFYRARGTEKSIRFLMRLLFNEDTYSIYYPKTDVLRASDGKWFVEKSLKMNEIKINGVTTNNVTLLKDVRGARIRGVSSNATAIVEDVVSYYEGDVDIKELKISSPVRSFEVGEQIETIFLKDGKQQTFSANILVGYINTVEITNPGSGYLVGDTITVESNTGTGAVVVISSVTTGNITSVFVNEGGSGAGFRVNDNLLFSGGLGAGAAGLVSVVKSDGLTHPNTYNIVSSIIQLEANTQIGNLVYSNLNSSNVNTSVANAVSYFIFANTGPVLLTAITAPGDDYVSLPSVSIVANTRVRTLGILGAMKIIDGGLNYAINDTIEFINVPFGYGTGAAANVTNVAANGRITEVQFVPVPGHITGGTGYEMGFLPTVKVNSANGTNANIIVTTVLGTGDSLRANTGTIGLIRDVYIVNRGAGYLDAPTLNLKSIGDGTAQAVATIITGTYTYPGRYVNDDGHLSSYNFLQDRDYYQNFSYVIKLKRSIEDYRKPLRELIHPSGMKLFGEYTFIDDENPQLATGFKGTSNTKIYVQYDNRPYRVANLSSNVTPGIRISMNTEGLSVNSAIYVGFNSGNISSYDANNIYYVSNVVNSTEAIVYTGTKIPVSMNLANRDTNTNGIYVENEGRILYVTGTTSDRVHRYNLIYPWDISSARYVNQSDIVDPSPTGLHFSSNGKFMYTIGSTTYQVRQFQLTTPWDTNTISFIASANVVSQEFSPQDIFFGSNGNILYVIGNGNDVVVQYNLLESWNIDTANYVVPTTLNVASRETNATALYFKPDGKRMYIGGSLSDRIHQYDLTQSWNIQSAVYVSNSAIFSLVEPDMRAISLNKKGDVVYVTGVTNDLLLQLPLREAWNISSMVLDRFNTTAANSGNVFVSKNIY